jgi:hypothetical protein
MLTTLAAFVIISVSVLLSFVPKGRMRRTLIAMWWLTPLWIALWLTVTKPADIDFEFGTRGALLVFTPFFLVLWAALTIFPCMLVLRIREISSRV